MSALGNYTPAAVTVVKAFAYPLRSAPTADLVAFGVNWLAGGSSAAALLDFLFVYPVPQSPFTAYGSASNNTAFVTAMVDNFTFGTTIANTTKAAWVVALVPSLAQYPSRGQFVLDIGGLLDNYTGNDAELLTLKAALADRAERAATFAQSPAGAVYNGSGFAQLLAPLAPPLPSYTLSATATSVNEGASVTVSLQTTQVAAGTTIVYTLSGVGITTTDVIGGQLTGSFTVNASGQASTTLALTNDVATEGAETLRLSLPGSLGVIDLVINDTSKAPPPPPTYALAASQQVQNEGSSVTFTLTTTGLAAGDFVSYLLLGNGITADDVVGKNLSGAFTLNAQGIGTLTVQLASDVTTEGNETLRLRLNESTQIDVTIVDTSLSPPPPGTKDTVVITDTMGGSPHLPASPLEGEIPLNSHLTYDFLNQAGNDNLRVSVAGLKGSNPVAGAPLNPNNHSADRGNVPQLSNQQLHVFDLGELTDRVDYSAETGKIVALVSAEAAPGTQYVLVNDNALDNNFGNATDRMDVLKSVEEIVASAGGGVLDLTASNGDWQITYSRGFNPNTDIDATKDRAAHRVEVTDLNTGSPWPSSYLEFRDAGASPTLTQANALWTQVQGSDRNETIVYTGAESLDSRLAVLRGGNNSVKFNELTRSILVDVAIAPWVESINPADDTNVTGQTVATTTFTTGDGVTPLSGATTLTRSSSPDHGVSAGTLRIVGSQDAEDAISFSGTALAKIIVLGESIGGADGASARLVGGFARAAFEVTGFELLRDNGASDDLYIIDDIFRATQGSPRLTDALGADHDAIRIADQALGSAAVGGAVGVVNLATLSGPAPGFNTDFDVLDLSAISVSGLQAVGTAGSDDELVLGRLGTVTSVTGFESLVLTRSSIDKGTALTLDLDSAVVKAGTTTLFPYAGSLLSAGGLFFNTAGQASSAAAADVGFNITVIDSTTGAGARIWGGLAADFITGGTGDDILRGLGGNDTLDGGIPGGTGSFTETWAFAITGTPDATALPANRISLAMTIDNAPLTLAEAAVADTAYGDGNGAFVDGAGAATIGTAMAALINANLASINAGPGLGTLVNASFDATSGTVLLTFLAGVNANDVVTFVLSNGAGPDGGNFTLSSGVNVNGGNGGADRYLFEASAAANGRDTILNFTAASDKLDVSAFAGSPIAAASPSINATTGAALAGVPTTAEFIFNKLQAALSSADFDTPNGGKFTIADGGRSVVVVSADPTGARGDAANLPVQLYYVINGPAAGISDLSVSLVGVISGPVELTLTEIFNALT